ncbi:methyl-accepting chemotaxis protein (plasmid) [Rhizobium sp. Pop5]|uniref:methyl-accepting chemotaxis protein n=3 Tax=Rhizobium sp. Pop5 TaxID=1223565 RepID=UPI0021571EE3|nr:methyl-accepting chemotaxis protein [Rhizobium sp. Pop5]UVD60021.1 methyl-accepting chemotaxis protein [Rhizobium sp. Pop5]
MLFKSTTGRNLFSIAACGVVAVVAASGVLFYSSYHAIRTESIEQMRQIARSEAVAVERDIGGTVHIVDSLDTVLSTMKQTGDADRARADKILTNMLEANTNVLGTWTGWEPDAFDGKDKEFVNKDGHDQTGRYIPYWVRSGGQITHAALTDYTVSGPGDYYQIPFRTGKTTVIEPYLYAIDGKDVLMTSVAKPIVIDGKAVGVAGLDLSLQDTNKAFSQVHPMETGFISLVTSAGKIVSHPNAGLIGKNLSEAGAETAGWEHLIANPGQEREVTGQDGTVSLAVVVPVRLAESSNWFAIVSVPKTTLFAHLDTIMRHAAISTGVAAVLLGLVGWLIARRFVSRISSVIDETAGIAAGKLDVRISGVDARDEIGDLSRSLEVLLEGNRQKAQLEAEAEAGRVQQDQERSERTRVAQAQEADVKFAVGELALGLARLAEGDMTVALEKPFTPALDEARTNFNESVVKLRSAMTSFSQNAQVIQAGADEIRAAADDLARRTEQQAASVEETAAALEQITTSVKDSTVRAEEAGSMVTRTKENAERSGQIVRSAVEAMHDIEQSSNSISNIIGVIDDIAFQTNLLALNAGVEAARAGEAGKGFAVVAQEVRELAQRSANAAKEIKALIISSGAQVKHGVDLVSQTGAVLTRIVEEVQQINQNVHAIVQSAREQSTGLQEINTAVNQMDQSTQQNAAMVEQSNAASHTLATEVTVLSDRLAQFRLDASSGAIGRHAGAQHHGEQRPRAAQISLIQRGAATSPAHALKQRLTTAFGNGSSATAAADRQWEDF